MPTTRIVPGPKALSWAAAATEHPAAWAGVAARASSHLRAGDACQGGEQVVLELRVEDGGVWRAESLVEPVSAAAAGLGFVARGEPLLGQVPQPEVVGGSRAPHPGRHPAGVDGV